MIGLMRVRMGIICSENGLLVCSHGPLELAQSVSVLSSVCGVLVFVSSS